MLIILLLIQIAFTSCLNFGELCDPSPIYSATWQFDDSCANVYLFCDATQNNTCNYKGCSNSDYIQNWDERLYKFPSRCNNQAFCPDSGSRCTPLVAVGGHCELQRDDECQGKEVACLNSTCFIKGAPLGGDCGSDRFIRTDYVSYDAAGIAIQQTIIRDNCTEGTYCNDQAHTCIPSKANGAECWQDRECVSSTCSDAGYCTTAPDTFHRIASWIWAVLGCSVLVFVVFVLGMLWVLHRYQSRKEHEKSAKFFGDNDEFIKYAQYYNVDSRESSQEYSRDDNRSSVVYLTTPDYNESAALATTRPLSWRNSNAALSKLRESE